MSTAATLVQNLRNRLSKPAGYRLFDIQLKHRITLGNRGALCVQPGQRCGADAHPGTRPTGQATVSQRQRRTYPTCPNRGD